MNDYIKPEIEQQEIEDYRTVCETRCQSIYALEKRVLELITERDELKKQLAVEKRAHEITIENCLITEKEDAGEIIEENIKLHLNGVRYLAAIEIDGE